MKTSLGFTDYQFEGASPSGTIWESKPTYNGQPHFELVLKKSTREARYLKTKLEYLSGHYVLENVQAVSRKIETLSLFLSLGWDLPTGLSFELGPLGILQTHRLADPFFSIQKTQRLARLGSFFEAGYEFALGAWTTSLRSSVGILGWPRRQSTASALELGIERHLSNSPWVVGLKGKKGLIQIERDENSVFNLGGANNAILLFRQGELDLTNLSLVLGYRL